MHQWQKNLYVLFLVNLLTIGGHSLIVPFLSLYIDELDASSGSTEFWAGMAFAAHALAITIASPIWGSLSDRVGRKVMAQRATFGGALVLSLLALVRTPLQLVLLRTAHGAITGIVPSSNALVGASVPPERTGYAMGLLNVAMWIGASIGPQVGGVIADTFGFRAVFYVTGACLLLAGIGVTLFIKEDFLRPEKARLSGREMLNGWSRVLRAPHMPEIYSIRFLSRTGDGLMAPFLPLFVVTLLSSQQRASTVTGLAFGLKSAFAALGALSLGRLGDRIGQRRLLVICSLGASLAYALTTLVTQSWQLVVLFAVMGLAVGGVFPAITTLMSHASPSGQVGAVYGVDHSVSGGARVVASLLGLAVISLMGLRGMFGVVAVVFALTALLAASHRLVYPTERG